MSHRLHHVWRARGFRLATGLVSGLVLALGAVVALPSLADAKDKKPKRPAAGGAPSTAAESGGAFDREAASSAISGVDLQKCKATNAAKGEGHAKITFAPTGAVSAAEIDRGPWIGTPVAKCISTQFKKAKIPAFKGASVTVGKSFHFD